MKSQQKLVLQHLEDISWKVLEEYPEIIRRMITGKWGVYALYRKDKLYYVGLANNLMGRLMKTILIISLFFIYIPEVLSQSLTAEQIYREVSNSVVVVKSLKNKKILKQGSGVIIDNEGHIVTNYHVYAGGEQLLISHNDEIYQSSGIIGADIEKDILIIQVKKNNITSIKIGAPGSVNIGAKVYAIGSPMGLENTISEGIISGLRQTEENGRKYIQITASISPGSSGGAVVNDKGELIGISTLTAREGQNLNFAIPIDEGLEVKNQ